MKHIYRISKLGILFFIIFTLYQDYCLSEEKPVVPGPDFSIADVKTLGRSLREGEMTVIYATVESTKSENLPTLDLFYIVGEKAKNNVAHEDKIFNVIPMFCMDSDIMPDKKVKNNSHLYRAEIPPQKPGLIIEYFIQAKDNDSGELVYPPDAPVSLKSCTISDNSNPFKGRIR
jgi:hypothetical protein